MRAHHHAAALYAIFTAFGAAGASGGCEECDDASLLQVKLSSTAQSRRDTDVSRAAQMVQSHAARTGRSHVAENVLDKFATSDSCDLCDGAQQWLFILGTGWSGSSAVFEMMNAVPGYHVVTETPTAFDQFVELLDIPVKMEKNTIENPGSAWHHEPISENRMLCAMQALTKSMAGEFDESTTSVIGFKVIQQFSRDTLNLFRRVFPCGRYIIAEREDIGAQHASSCSSASGCVSLRSLYRSTAVIEKWRRENPSDSFSVKLEESSVDRFNQLLGWLDVQGCNFTRVAHTSAEVEAGLGSKSTGPLLSGDCVTHPWANVPAAVKSPWLPYDMP